jgi:hypothetical protein
VTVQARLDKARERVLCGKRECGQELAAIVGITRSGPPSVRTAPRYVMLAPRWKQVPSGRYVASEHAKKRWRSDQQWAGNRDPGGMASEAARQRLAEGMSLRYRSKLTRKGNPNSMYNRGDEQFQQHTTITLPAELLCHKCGAVNILDATTLDASPTLPQSPQ